MDWYLILVIFLLGLAVFDLIVGVSNDAVNFLTSAVGSRAASFKTIMWVASIGIFIGAASSGGMMEIAKSGIFTPSFFTFQDVLFIYVAVMLSDVMLLDLFNSFKLPTSTTISIVFELLGASIIVTFIKLVGNGTALVEWTNYINTGKALEMIIAIFVSVAVAFIVGWLVQYIMRALTTFDYKKYMVIGGSVFGAVAMVTILNFIVNVALKNSPYGHTDIVAYISSHFLPIGAIVAVLFAVVSALLVKFRKFNVFKFITLLGTFALAMAFASNDLVNFIGVPLASLEGYHIWHASGLAPDQVTMEAFLKPGSSGSTWLLILAGLIMIITLRYSRKAKNVIKTTVDLSRKSDGIERFQGNFISRGIVKTILFIVKTIGFIIPGRLKQVIEGRYNTKPSVIDEEADIKAFDFVRASVNLIVSAFLISIGTSLKLPLSTTYVSFMVVMGTSLADRAWSRDSAVYRVSGVLSVIGGWFLTAISALVISGIFATVIMSFGFVGFLIVLVTVFIVIFIVNKLMDSSVTLIKSVELPESWFSKPLHEISDEIATEAKETEAAYLRLLKEITDAIKNEDAKSIKDVRKRTLTGLDLSRRSTEKITNYLKYDDIVKNPENGAFLLEFYYLGNLLIQQLNQMTDTVYKHIINLHNPMSDEQIKDFDELVNYMEDFCETISSTTGNEKPAEKLLGLKGEINDFVKSQIDGVAAEEYNYKNSMLYFNILYINLECAELLVKIDQMADSAKNIAT